MTHPGLNFKPWKNRDEIWSVRVGGHYRALCVKDGDDWVVKKPGAERVSSRHDTHRDHAPERCTRTRGCCTQRVMSEEKHLD